MQFFLDYTVNLFRGPWLDILRNNTQTFIRLDVYMQKLNRWLGLYLVCTMFDQNQQITYIRVQQCAIDMSPMRDHEMFKQCLNRQTSTSRRLKGTQSQPCACPQSVIFCQIFFHNVLFKSYSINANASKRIFVCFLNVFIQTRIFLTKKTPYSYNCIRKHFQGSKSLTFDRCIFEKLRQEHFLTLPEVTKVYVYNMVYKTRFEGDKYEPFEVLDTEKGDPFECK